MNNRQLSAFAELFSEHFSNGRPVVKYKLHIITTQSLSDIYPSECHIKLRHEDFKSMQAIPLDNGGYAVDINKLKAFAAKIIGKIPDSVKITAKLPNDYEEYIFYYNEADQKKAAKILSRIIQSPMSH